MRSDRELRELVVTHDRAKRAPLCSAAGKKTIEKLSDRYRFRREVNSAITSVERLAFGRLCLFPRAERTDAFSATQAGRARFEVDEDRVTAARSAIDTHSLLFSLSAPRRRRTRAITALRKDGRGNIRCRMIAAANSGSSASSSASSKAFRIARAATSGAAADPSSIFAIASQRSLRRTLTRRQLLSRNRGLR